MNTTILSPADLAPHLGDASWIVVDCRFSLADAERGRSSYLEGHIPGAVYAHLNEDLSGAVVPGVTGRHPLPTSQVAAATCGRLGIAAGMQVVAYDDMGGALAAARLWWMLRWLGHEAVAVLDGGWQRWQAQGLPVHTGIETRPTRIFTPRPRPEMLVSADEVDVMRRDGRCKVLDARAAERFHGQNETIDPVAGHIPGAISAPFAENLTPEGVFRPAGELRARYQALLGGIPAEKAAVYCGSGVTSIHDILAMRIAGLGEAKLFAGSWSEWITNPARPVER